MSRNLILKVRFPDLPDEIDTGQIETWLNETLDFADYDLFESVKYSGDITVESE